MEREVIPCCQEDRVHVDAVDQVRALLRSELCVCDIADLLGLTQSAISHQLRVLRSSKLVKFRREGKTVYYSLADEHVVRILSQGMEHIEE